MNTSLQAKLVQYLDQQPHHRAIAFYDQDDRVSWYSFEEFYLRAAGYATRLADHGLGKGDICILVLPSDEYCASLLMSVLTLGGIPLLISPPVLQGEGAYSSLSQILKRMIRKTNARIVVCTEAMAYMREELERVRRGTHILFAKDVLPEPSPKSAPLNIPAGDDVALMQLTSGTTGFPRICVWKQKNVLAALDGMAKAMKLNTEDICLNWTPLYHDMGLVNNFLLCITHGIPLVMLDPKDFVKNPALWLRGLSNTGATLTWSPNFGFAIAAQRVREREMEDVKLEGVRAFWNAAERIHHNTMQTFYERFARYGVRAEALKTNFGCAENIGGATFSDPDGAYLVEHINHMLFLKEGIAVPVSKSRDGNNSLSVVGVGRPHPDLGIKILSRAGRPLPEGQVGEIALETPSRMTGYHSDAPATRRALYGNLLRTGDLGYLRGNELFWVGRVRERITVRGKKLDPSDFEPILLKIKDLRHGSFAAFGVDDDRLGTQRIVLVSEVREAASRTPSEIAEEIRGQAILNLGITVNEVLLVRKGTLTKTSSGKRRHRFFRDLYLQGRLNDFEWSLNEVGVSGD